ncbi:MAG: GNAT family N-acetyltransferase [Lachnospiraceae bacterium]|nr:GNAT family N-acetyltransferase [Lachnospiraceae bacterium]
MTFEIMKPDEIDACTEIAAKAFLDYDFFSLYVPTPEKQLPHLRNMFSVEYRVNQGLYDCLVTKKDGVIVAVAIVRAPDYKMPSDLKYIKAGIWKNAKISGLKNVAAWYMMDVKAERSCHEYAPDSWYLHLLAVDPAYQGKGIGSSMIREYILPFVREHGGKSLTLFTNSDKNCHFYQKNGFEMFDTKFFSYKGKTFGNWSFIQKIEL